MRRARVLLVLAAALIAGGCGAATSTTSTPTGAAVGGVLAMAPRPGSAPAPAPAARAKRSSLSVAATARAFSSAYARYLDGRLPAAALPDASPVVRPEVGPVISHRERAGELVVQSVSRTDGGVQSVSRTDGGVQSVRRTPGDTQSVGRAPGNATFDALLRDRAHTFVVQLTVAQTAGRWLVVSVVPPDLDSILHAQSAPLPQPPASGAPEHAARIFMAGYLPWLYGEGPVSGIHGAAATLIARLKTHPLRIPPMFRGLHVRLISLGMRRLRLGWEAFALITDGRESYDLVLSVRHGGRRWLVFSAASPG